MNKFERDLNIANELTRLHEIERNPWAWKMALMLRLRVWKGRQRVK